MQNSKTNLIFAREGTVVSPRLSNKVVKKKRKKKSSNLPSLGNRDKEKRKANSPCVTSWANCRILFLFFPLLFTKYCLRVNFGFNSHSIHYKEII